MKFSIVTISFNQANFLEQALRSVLDQNYSNIEYIVVDSGSTDGSREIIERYRTKISRIIFEQDHGPADGLNKGFAVATGEIFAFLNSDDVLLQSTIGKAAAYFRDRSDIDVIYGHSLILDAQGRKTRVSYSDPFSLPAIAYGSCVLMQPSTFFKKEAYQLTKGFDIKNKSTWDAQLFIEMGLGGARFCLADEVWSGYRVHANSITGSRKMVNEADRFEREMFKRIMNREKGILDNILSLGYRARKYINNPSALYQRVRFGPVHRGICT